MTSFAATSSAPTSSIIVGVEDVLEHLQDTITGADSDILAIVTELLSSASSSDVTLVSVTIPLEDTGNFTEASSLILVTTLEDNPDISDFITQIGVGVLEDILTVAFDSNALNIKTGLIVSSDGSISALVNQSAIATDTAHDISFIFGSYNLVIDDSISASETLTLSDIANLLDSISVDGSQKVLTSTILDDSINNIDIISGSIIVTLDDSATISDVLPILDFVASACRQISVSSVDRTIYILYQNRVLQVRCE